MSTLFIFILLVMVCLQAFYIVRANKKLAQYKINIIHKTEQLNRFHDIYRLHFDFGWLTRPFLTYVMKGGDIEDVRDEALLEYEQLKSRSVVTKSESQAVN